MIAWAPVIADPPLYSADAIQRMTLDDILNANEALALRNELARRAMAKQEAKRPRR